MPEQFLFLDFDDTLSDRSLFIPQYINELSSNLTRLYGGEKLKWESACARMISDIEQSYLAIFIDRPDAGYRTWLDETRLNSITTMFERVGCALPEEPDRVAKELQFNALIGCNAAFPNAFETMNTLYESGYRIQISSANESEFLLAALIGAGIESFTESKFGPDLVDCAKEGPLFFEKIFEAAQVKAEDAIVIDDHPAVLQWAKSLGARVVQARMLPSSPELVSFAVGTITELRQLPHVLKTI